MSVSSPPGTPTYHVLLIGIDVYPQGYNSLTGCVNDIDAVERMLLDPPGMGLPPEQVRVTRLAAASSRRPSKSRLQAQTLPPTKANLIESLKALTGPEVKPEDRVLIYYSGHGDEKLWPGSPVWHEALVPHDGRRIEYLYDIEVNALVHAITLRTKDLTVVLDCCHSAGATRDLSGVLSQGADRHLMGNPGPGEPPDLTALGLPEESLAGSSSTTRLLQNVDPNYLVIVACQPDEKAGEGLYPGEERAHGIFTYSFMRLLQDKSAEERARLRWADVWSELLENVSTRCAQLGRRSQLPWYIGRLERPIFGGAWEIQDRGYSITRLSENRYKIGAGSLTGITQDAEVAVYGPEPALFAAIGSPEDQPIGRLRVIQAESSSCIATALGATFNIPQGARGRLVRPGENERLRVTLKPEDADLAAKLCQSTLLEVVPSGSSAADVEVITQPDGSWAIGNEVEPILALVPAMEVAALRAGLDWYYRYHTVMQLAKRCNDPQLNRSLYLQLLDCDDAPAIQAMTQEELADPSLPEANHDEQGVYHLVQGARTCVKMSNLSSKVLQVTLFNCTASGAVEYQGDVILREGASHVLWAESVLGQAFSASADGLPTPLFAAERPFVTHRLIAIGTTRRDVDLNSLRVEKTVQEVIEENVQRPTRRSLFGQDDPSNSSNPVELWTATTVPVRIDRG